MEYSPERKSKRRTPVRVPSEDTVEHWLDQGWCLCSGPCRCRVELDGTCPNGHPSRMLALGLI